MLDRRSVVYQAWFWHPSGPWDLKYAMEKAVRTLLVRVPEQETRLTFEGSVSVDPQYRARLTFEAASPERNLYILRMDATAPVKWFTDARLEQEAGKVFDRWTANVRIVRPPHDLDACSPVLYRQLYLEALLQEAAEAAFREDQAPVEALRQEVAEAIRGGKRCTVANKEGHTSYFWDGTQFVRQHWGEWEERVVFASAADMLASLREFYDWDTRRDTYPHRPPELESWKLIQSKLR